MLNLSARGTPVPGHPGDPRRRQLSALDAGRPRLAWSMGPTLYSAARRLLRARRADRLHRAATRRFARDHRRRPTGRRPDRPGRRADHHHGRRRRRRDRGWRDPHRRQPHPRRRRRARRCRSPPARAQVDLAGKTIIPGIIDGHAHGQQGEDDIVPQQNWSALSHLAMGVTTVHDPSSTASEIFAAGEMQRAGLILAPAHLLVGRDRLRRPLAGPLRADRFL